MSSGCLVSACWKVLRPFAAGDQPAQPASVGPGVQQVAWYQCRLLALTLPTTTLFFSTAAAAISAQAAAVIPRRHVRRLSDRRCRSNPIVPMRVGDHLPHAGAFDDGIRFEADVPDGAGMVGRAQIAVHQVLLGTGVAAIQDVHVQAE